MYNLSKEEMIKIAPIFEGWNETLIWSCLQGYMGRAWTNDIKNPQSVQIITADFCFFACVPDAALVRNFPEDFPENRILMIPQNDKWSHLIEAEYNDNCERFIRYAIKKEPDVFDREKLKSNIEKLPSEYCLRNIDEAIYHKIKDINWLNSLCSQFPTYSDFEEHGLGFIILHDNQPVSGAASYTIYDKGIEIEIDTIEDYRRRGLALACASKLIIECLDRGLYPSWDAAHMGSVALAEKLGYHFDREYVAYRVRR